MIKCPRCGEPYLDLRTWNIIFCKSCDFEFKGTLEELEVQYE